MSDLPIVCTLTPDALASRRSELLASLMRQATGVEMTDAGCRLRFAASSDALMLIARTIDAERQCCQFLEFRVTVTPGLGAMLLEVTGPAGTRDFVKDLLGGA
jgi:hypothetical protein